MRTPEQGLDTIFGSSPIIYYRITVLSTHACAFIPHRLPESCRPVISPTHIIGRIHTPRDNEARFLFLTACAQQRAIVAQWCGRTLSLPTNVMADGTGSAYPSTASSRSPLCEGGRARVHSLKARGDLNNLIAKLLCWKAAAGRWQCRVGMDNVQLLPQNLKALSEELPWVVHGNLVLSHEIVIHVASFISVHSMASAACTCRALAAAMSHRPFTLQRPRVVKPPVLDEPWASANVDAIALMGDGRVCIAERALPRQAKLLGAKRLACYDARGAKLLPVWQKHMNANRPSLALTSTDEAVYLLVASPMEVYRYTADGVMAGCMGLSHVFPHLWSSLQPAKICAHQGRLLVVAGDVVRKTCDADEGVCDPVPTRGSLHDVEPIPESHLHLPPEGSDEDDVIGDGDGDEDEEADDEAATLLLADVEDGSDADYPDAGSRYSRSRVKVLMSCALDLTGGIRWRRILAPSRSTQFSAAAGELFFKAEMSPDLIALSLDGDGHMQRRMRMPNMCFTTAGIEQPHDRVLMGTGRCIVFVKPLVRNSEVQNLAELNSVTSDSFYGPWRGIIEVWNPGGEKLAQAEQMFQGELMTSLQVRASTNCNGVVVAPADYWRHGFSFHFWDL